MITFYLFIVGIIVVSLIISVTITYLYIKLIFLVSERYTLYSRNKSSYPSGDKGEYTSDTIKFVVFLKSIYHFTHLNDIWSRLGYPFRKHYANSKINGVYCNEESKGSDENNQGSPETCFHTGNISKGVKPCQPK